MKATFRDAIVATLVGAVGAAASGRQTYPYRKMVHSVPNSGDWGWAEAALAVSSQSPGHLAVSWIENATDQNGLHVVQLAYAISNDTGANFADGILDIPSHCYVGFHSFQDPFAAASQTADALYVGGGVIEDVNEQAVWVWPIGPGATTLGSPSAAFCRHDPNDRYIDKPFIGVGPTYGAPSTEAMYLFFSDYADPNPAHRGFSRLFGRLADLSSLTWNSAPIDVRRPGGDFNEEGVAIVPVVLPNQRVVATWRPFDHNIPNYPTGRWPVVMHSNNGGQDWLGAPPPANPNVPIELDHSGPNDPGDSIYAVGAADLPSNTGVGVNTVPGIAFDPLDPNLVYVIYWGKSSATDGNVDLYIAQSRDGGVSFSVVNTLHLTDSLLGDAPGTDQVLPAITVDGFHGVNIFWYAVVQTADDVVTLQPKWGRITNFSADPTQVQIVTSALAPKTTLPIVTGHGITGLGDYYMIASSGCWVYSVYMSADVLDPTTGLYPSNIYVSRIYLPQCAATDIADFNQDGVVNVADAAAYITAFGAGLPSADVTHDQVINATDFVTYMNAYTSSTSP